LVHYNRGVYRLYSGPLDAVPGHVALRSRHFARRAAARTAARLHTGRHGINADAAAASDAGAEALSRRPPHRDARHRSAQGRHEPRRARRHTRFGNAAARGTVSRRPVRLEPRLPEARAPPDDTHGVRGLRPTEGPTARHTGGLDD